MQKFEQTWRKIDHPNDPFGIKKKKIQGMVNPKPKGPQLICGLKTTREE
jgi:hypothetical protein